MAQPPLTNDEIAKFSSQIDLCPVITRAVRDNIKKRLVTELLEARGHSTEDIHAHAYLNHVSVHHTGSYIHAEGSMLEDWDLALQPRHNTPLSRRHRSIQSSQSAVVEQAHGGGEGCV